MTIYYLKSRFQDLLRPVTSSLHQANVTANQVTVAAAAGSILVGLLLIFFKHIPVLFLLIPFWMFIRMALNAIDGMLAREFNQKSDLGAYLNEICDVISDAALYLPFAFIAPFDMTSIMSVIFLAILSEYAGVLGLSVGASRRYDGPMGKSDRAFIFGILGLFIGLGFTLPNWMFWTMPIIALLIALTIFNRIKSGLSEKGQ